MCCNTYLQLRALAGASRAGAAAALVDVHSLPVVLGTALAAAVGLPLAERAVWQRRARQQMPGVPGA